MKILDKSLPFNTIRESMQKLTLQMCIAERRIVLEFGPEATHFEIVEVNVLVQ